ncbi:MAG: hypothetical protein JO257_35200 [Deltaproteobacteria bacterium]|nr:hypothetical protein [Deltaproteobacteria bacterium]
MRTFALLALAGCHVSAGGSATITDDLGQPQGALGRCAAGDLKDQLAIVGELRDSYHEMIVCGGLALSFDDAIVNVIAHAALGRGGPSQLRYQGNGTYATSNGMMMIKTALASGGGIGFDVLDPQSYLAGIAIDASGSLDAVMRGGSPWQMAAHAAGSLDVRFTGQGPGAMLLGLTADELRGGVLHIDPKRIEKALGDTITVTNRIDVENEQGDTVIHYVLDGAPEKLGDVLANKHVPMQLVSIEATRKSTGQTIRITDWTMQFRGDGGTVLDGAIALDVDGGAFPYSVRFTYPHRKEPDVELRCRTREP